MSTMAAQNAELRRPRLGFLGLGRIGLLRLKALAEAGVTDAVAIADPVAEMVEVARAVAPDAAQAGSFAELLDHDLDGVVIATPSALHAEQAIAAFNRGLAVFCQKPLGRTEDEVRAVVDAARSADRLLGVDFSYRYTAGMMAIRELIATGELGEVFAIDLVFHNAYGPDKAWFFDKALSGGGCVMDLGVHLVDLALWALDYPPVVDVTGRLVSQGRPMRADSEAIEDFATATFALATGTQVRIACSWHLHAGRDAVIGADFYGTKGGASLHNVAGSFLNFQAEHHTGTATSVLSEPPDPWPGRAPVAWAQQLAESGRFDPAAEHVTEVAAVLDRIYGR